MGTLQHVFVQVGGLCMLVQHDRKLFVLMPRMEHAGHRHCQFLHVNDPYASGGGLWSLKGGTLDLSFLSNRGSPQSTGDIVLETSRWTGNSPVTASHLQGAGSPGGPLAARVILPLPFQPFKALGKPAELMLLGPGMPIGPVKSHGRVGIRIAVSANLDELRIPWPGVTLTPDARGSVELTLLNMRPKDLGEDPERIEPGALLHHLEAYFTLLDLGGKTPPTVHAPNRSIPGDPPRPGDTDCLAATFKPFPRWGFDFPNGQEDPGVLKSIDPYNCTVGSGCPTSNPC